MYKDNIKKIMLWKQTRKQNTINYYSLAQESSQLAVRTLTHRSDCVLRHRTLLANKFGILLLK